MKKYINRTAIVLYINILIGLIHGLHELEVLNFMSYSYYKIIPIAFLLTFVLWNILMTYDKKK